MDNSLVEESVVRAIEQDPHVAQLVDELFFEFHFFGEPPPFNKFWGPRNVPQNHWSHTNATVDTALRQMARLRHQGIRAHFWI